MSNINTHHMYVIYYFDKRWHADANTTAMVGTDPYPGSYLPSTLNAIPGGGLS